MPRNTCQSRCIHECATNKVSTHWWHWTSVFEKKTSARPKILFTTLMCHWSQHIEISWTTTLLSVPKGKAGSWDAHVLQRFFSMLTWAKVTPTLHAFTLSHGSDCDNWPYAWLLWLPPTRNTWSYVFGVLRLTEYRVAKHCKLGKLRKDLPNLLFLHIPGGSRGIGTFSSHRNIAKLHFL